MQGQADKIQYHIFAKTHKIDISFRKLTDIHHLSGETEIKKRDPYSPSLTGSTFHFSTNRNPTHFIVRSPVGSRTWRQNVTILWHWWIDILFS